MLHRFSIRHPWPVLLLASVIVLAAGPGIVRLRLRTDGHALVPEDSPAIIADAAIRARFDAQDLLVVLIRSPHPDGVFNADALRLIQGLTEALQQLEGIDRQQVTSLQTEHSHRVREGTLDFRRFLEPVPRTPEELARLRDDLQRIALPVGTVVSDDGRSAAILVGVPPGRDRTALYGRVRELIAAHGPRSETVHVIGAPVAESLLGIHILEDLGLPAWVMGTLPTHAPADLRAGQGRWPRSLDELRVLIARRIGLVPVALAVMALVFAVSFRSLLAAGLPLLEVGACLVFVFGLMGWMQVPVYLTIAVLPVILTVVGVTDEIHIFMRYQQLLREQEGASAREVLLRTMQEMQAPVVKTSVTTAVGFLSFALSPLNPVRAFGMFTAVGVIFCMFWSLSVIPASLALLGGRWAGRARGQVSPHVGSVAPAATLAGRWFTRVGAGLAGRGRYAVWVGVLAVLAGAPFGVRRLTVQDSWIDGFAPSSDFYEATRYFNEHFLGTHMLLVHVQAPAWTCRVGVPAAGLEPNRIVLPTEGLTLPAPLDGDPRKLAGKRVTVTRATPGAAADSRSERPGARRRDTWSAWIEEVAVDGYRLLLTPQRRGGSPLATLRPAPDETLVCELSSQPLREPQVLRTIEALEAFIRDQRQCTVGGVIGPASYLATANHMVMGLREGTRVIPDDPDRVEWVWRQYERIRGPQRLRQLVTADYGEALVMVFLKNANYVAVGELLRSLQAYEEQHLRPERIALGYAGDVAVSQTVIDAIVTTQVRSLLGSLLGITLVTTCLGHSLRWGLLSVLPSALAVLINFAVMGLAQIPLGVATSMFAGMTLGISVDFAIHLLERYRLVRDRGMAVAPAVLEALAVMGPAIVIDALGVVAGFAVLVLSQVPVNARLGMLLALSVGVSLLATLLLLPVLLRLGRRAAHDAAAR
ncbi:MAG TPA: MMPL family transporter [Phycisphaerae bacterium]|nr:MMPL family transporter [Phycisphaerae bacterium]HNU45368.1 MMPL family transporter [Phycisphaerae bacterium]